MTEQKPTIKDRVLVAVDVSKSKHDALIQFPDGQRKKFIIRNRRDEFEGFTQYLKDLKKECVVGFEATADYHRNFAYFVKSQGFELKLLSSIAVAKTREALHNSWDKNDPKDAQVILHLMSTGVTQYYYDPLIEGTNDLQELSNTHFQTSLRKTRLQHSIMNHFLPLYFPEAERFLCATRAGWFARLLTHFPIPSSVVALQREEFISAAMKLLPSKHNKRSMLLEFYEQARQSIGLPVALNSKAVEMFKLMLNEHTELCEKRAGLEKTAHELLKNDNNYKILRSVPGVGPIIALTIIAEAGDLRRFHHERQFLKFCGLDLSTQQSGNFRGQSKISKRGNARLRCVLWLAATIAVRMRENTFQKKFSRYIKTDPQNADLKRRAYTATTAKLARVIYGLIKNQQFYRSYYEDAVKPDGRTRSHVP